MNVPKNPLSPSGRAKSNQALIASFPAPAATLAWLLVVLLLTTLRAGACLGDTQAQLEARYGPPDSQTEVTPATAPDGTVYISESVNHHHSCNWLGFWISTRVKNGVCVHEGVSGRRGNSLSQTHRGTPLSQTQALEQAWRIANTTNLVVDTQSPLQNETTRPGTVFWRNGDGTIGALYDPTSSDGLLIVKTLVTPSTPSSFPETMRFADLQVKTTFYFPLATNRTYGWVKVSASSASNTLSRLVARVGSATVVTVGLKALPEDSHSQSQDRETRLLAALRLFGRVGDFQVSYANPASAPTVCSADCGRAMGLGAMGLVVFFGTPTASGGPASERQGAELINAATSFRTTLLDPPSRLEKSWPLAAKEFAAKYPSLRWPILRTYEHPRFAVIRDMLGEPDATYDDQLDKAPVRWFKYGWCQFGVAKGIVVVLRADGRLVR